MIPRLCALLYNPTPALSREKKSEKQKHDLEDISAHVETMVSQVI
jgi:hypothetical protein